MGRTSTLVTAFIIIVALVVPVLVSAIPASAQPQYSDVYSAYQEGLQYIYGLYRYAYDPATAEPIYAFVAEYPSVPVWGKYASYTWIPALELRRSCGISSMSSGATEVDIQLVSESLGTLSSSWVYDYTFKFIWNTPYGPVPIDVAKLRVQEVQYLTGSWKVTVAGLSYSDFLEWGECGTIIGGDIQVYVAGFYLGTVRDLVAQPYVLQLQGELPSFRFSARHVLMMSSIFLDASGPGNIYIENAATGILNAVFGAPRDPIDLYGNAFFSYPVQIDIPALDRDDEDHEYFFDAMEFGFETGWDRIFAWVQSEGLLSPNSGAVSYPIYPYKSNVVLAAVPGLRHGGDVLLYVMENPATCGTSVETDPLLNAWRGVYYATQGQWGKALGEWLSIVDDWDGIGIKACYSENYSTVRLAAAIMLGTLLADRGYIGWDTVDRMVEALLKAQWDGSGYYKPSGGSWTILVKNDHAGGFLVSYNLAPNLSFGSTGFRPDYLDLITEPWDMNSEYLGPLPTNAETTLAALMALKLYMDSRY